MSRNTILAVLVFIWGAVFARVESNYFGNNLLPKSAEECICDGIAILIASIGVLILALGREDRK